MSECAEAVTPPKQPALVRLDRYGDLYGELMRELKKAGFTPDQADDAARLAERALRERRDACIKLAKTSGLTIRVLSKIWGLSVRTIHKA